MKPIKSNALLTTALATGIASSANAAVVQISLTNNKISTLGGNQLDADFIGDSNNDVIITVPLFGAGGVFVTINGFGLKASAVVTGSGGNTSTNFQVDAAFAAGGVGMANDGGSTSRNINYLNPIIFTDATINGGAPTEAWLQVNAFNSGASNHTVALTSLIYDNASTTRPIAVVDGGGFAFTAVPEPSSIGLLALGGAGVLLRRNRKKAA